MTARWLHRAPRTLATVAVCVLLGTLATSCHWLRYHDLVLTHVDLMEGIANDAGAAIQAGNYRLNPTDLKTMAYPLERAIEFLGETRGRRERSPSRRHLEEFVVAYRALYVYLDRVRITPGDKRARKAAALVATVVSLAAATRAAVDEETGS